MVTFLKKIFIAYNDIPYPFLFSEYFMRTFTQLDNWEMFLDVLQVQIASEEKFEHLFETQKEVRELTGFSSWLEMKDKAEEIYYECYPFGIQPMH